MILTKVTICNKNPFKVENTDIDNADTISQLNAGAEILLNASFSSLETSNYWFYLAGLFSIYYNVTGAKAYKYSYTISEMLLNCRFNNIECSQNDFVYYHSFMNGNCYKFNSG